MRLLQINISFENAEELKKLLHNAITLAEQLQETLQQIQKFEPKIKLNSKSES